MDERDVFISYARSTEAVAKRLEHALRDCGYAVWRDNELPPHRAYADVIQERLSGAKAVIVLWSGEAARSQWVRAEADCARIEGKLVQVRLDATQPPIPFNQIQCLDFTRWRDARTDQTWRILTETLDHLLAKAPVAAIDGERRAPRSALLARLLRRRWRAIGVGSAAALVLALAWLAPRLTPAAEGTVEVANFTLPSSDPRARRTASEISASLIRILSGGGVPTTAAAGGGADKPPEIRIGGSLEFDQDKPIFDSRLTDVRSGDVLWSWRFDEDNAGSDFVGGVSETYGAILHCALEDRKTAKAHISTSSFGLYLNACAAVMLDLAPSRMLAVTRQLVAANPDFAAAHAMHAIAAGRVVNDGEHSAEEVVAVRAEGQSAAARAISLDPTFPKTYVAAALLRPKGDYLDQERDLKMALKYAPDLPPPLHMLAVLLRNVGRLRESAELQAGSAASGDPRAGTSGYTDVAIAWAAAGETDKANEAILHLEPAFPAFADHARWMIALAHEDPKTALAHIRAYKTNVSPASEACAEAFLTGLIAAAGSKRTGLPNECAGSPRDRRINMLAREGDIDGAYTEFRAYMARKDFVPSVLFMPEMASFRADPRFIPLVKEIGITAYWRASGHWPDFCDAPDRPYDCRTAVAALT